MIWLAFRQFRATLICTAALVLMFVGLLAVHGFSAHRLVSGAAAHGCLPTDLPQCGDLARQLTGRLHQLTPYLGYLAMTPPLIGAFWGAPLIAREAESGTAALTWSQSVTRRRWLTVQLAVGGATVTLLGLVLGFSITAWMSVFAGLHEPGTSIYESFVFHGVLPAAEWLAAFLIGAVAGTLARRTVPAIAATVIVVFGIVITLALTSDTYIPPQSTTAGVFVGQLIESGLLLAAGAAAVALVYRRIEQVSA